MADIVILSTADWDHPLWTNKQHVALALRAEGHRVLYIESLGLRASQSTGKDFRRIVKRLGRGLRPPKRIRSGLWVWSPLVLPGGAHGVPLFVNRFSLSCGLWFALRSIKFLHPWLWTYNPLTARYLSLKEFSLQIYHAVDALQEQPCMPRDLIEVEEHRLCALVDQVFVTSPQLERKLRPYSKHIRFDPNVADQSHFAQAMTLPPSAIPSDLSKIPAPRIGFMGAISSYKLDFALIISVAQCHPDWSFVFIGPIGEGEPHTDIALLERVANVHLIGTRPYAQLPAYCSGFDCGWLPLQNNPYTQAMFPMKFFEYLGAGLPVVATSIDALKQFSSAAVLCSGDPQSFDEGLQRCLAGQGPSLSERLALAAEHTYTSRTRRMLSTLESRQ